MPDTQALLSPAEFAQTIKAKYPDYASVPDDVLVAKVLEKYPEYRDRVQTADFKASNETDASGNPVVRFAEGAWKNLNPVAAAKGLYEAGRHPMDTASNILQSQSAQLDKAKALYDEGRHVEAAGHLLAGLLPILGPAAAASGERIATGDIAGGLGEAFGLLAPFGAASAVKGAVAAVPTKMADALESGAKTRVVDVMAPKVGANKARFGGMAESVATAITKDLAADGAPFSREGLHTQIGAKLAEAEQALDGASDARLNARTFPTKPLINGLLEKRKALTAETVEGSEFTPQSGVNRPPLGADVVPGPNADRVAVIDKAISELKQLGPVAHYESIRRVRQAYDGPAKAVYSPAVTQDFLKAQGGKFGAADVTGVLRDNLAQWDPATAKANADYSLYRKANDVLDATAEVERTRPKVGRQIMARLTGTLAGEQAAGVPGAVAGFVLGPLMDQAVSSGLTMKMQTARIMTDLAQAIRSGDVGRVTSLSFRIKKLVGQAAVQVENLTPPTESGARLPMPVGTAAR